MEQQDRRGGIDLLRGHRALLAALLAALTACGPATAAQRDVRRAARVTPAQYPSGGLASGEATFERSWTITCTPNACEQLPIGYLELSTPANVDVVATATLEYKTSAGDRARLELFYTPSGTPGPRITMPPGKFHLSSATFSSTTLSWAQKDVPGGGQGYFFQAGISAEDNDGDGKARVSGARVTLVVEFWLAAD
jgi:hypothetical protein